MSARTLFILFTWLCLCAVSCSDKDATPPIVDSKPRSKNPPPASWLVEQMKQAPLDCQEATACPAAVGMIGFYRQDHGEKSIIEQCTGFLYKKNIVATNGHCVSELVRRQPDMCSKSMAIKFAGSGEIRPCKRLLSYSQKQVGFDLEDYAFFVIDEVPGLQPLPISRLGVGEEELLSVYKIDPLVGEAVGGTLVKLENICRPVKNSLLNLYYIDNFSQTVLARDCDAVAGNSGSPVLSHQGVVGLLQSHKTHEYLNFLGRQLAQRNNLLLPGVLPEHFIFSNMACIPDPETGESAANNCGAVENKSLGHVFHDLVKPAPVSIEMREEAWKKSLPPLFNFLYERTNGYAHIFTAIPTCVKPLELWPQEWLSLLSTNEEGQQVLLFKYQDMLRLEKEYRTDSDLRFWPQIFYIQEEHSMDLRLTISAENQLKVEEKPQSAEGAWYTLYMQWCKDSL